MDFMQTSGITSARQRPYYILPSVEGDVFDSQP